MCSRGFARILLALAAAQAIALAAAPAIALAAAQAIAIAAAQAVAVAVAVAGTDDGRFCLLEQYLVVVVSFLSDAVVAVHACVQGVAGRIADERVLFGRIVDHKRGRHRSCNCVLFKSKYIV